MQSSVIPQTFALAAVARGNLRDYLLNRNTIRG
jgi:hypothetical protein